MCECVGVNSVCACVHVCVRTLVCVDGGEGMRVNSLCLCDWDMYEREYSLYVSE